MMTWIAAVFCVALVAANVALYQRHRARIAGREVGRAPYRLSWPTRVFRFFKVLLYIALLAHVAWEATRQAPSVEGLVAGLLLGGAALALLHWSFETLGVNFSPCDSGLEPVERVTAGPYRLLRHPIYVANLLMLGAIGLVWFGPILVAITALLLVFYAFAIYDEEQVWRGDADETKVGAA